MFKIFESSVMKKQQDGHNFTIGHFAGTITVFFTIFRSNLMFFDFLGKIFTKVVCDAKNFNSLSWVSITDFLFNYLYISNKNNRLLKRNSGY